VDPPHSPFVKQLLLDLHDAVRSLRQEKGALQCQLQDAERSNVALQGAFADAERSNAALQGALADARRENAAIQAAYVEARRENADVDGRRDVQSLQVVLVGRIGQLEKERMYLFSALLCCVMVLAVVLCFSVGVHHQACSGIPLAVGFVGRDRRLWNSMVQGTQ